MTRARRVVVIIATMLAMNKVAPADPIKLPENLRDSGVCWWPRIAAVLAVANGTVPKDVEFDSAVSFLVENTGIESGLQVTFTGYVVDRGRLRERLKRWIGWYVDFDPYLYWDVREQRYSIDKDAQRRNELTNLPRAPADGNCSRSGKGGLKELFDGTPKK